MSSIISCSVLISNVELILDVFVFHWACIGITVRTARRATENAHKAILRNFHTIIALRVTSKSFKISLFFNNILSIGRF